MKTPNQGADTLNDMRLDIENSPELAADLADAYAANATIDQMQRMIVLLNNVSPGTFANNGIAIDSFTSRLRTHIAQD